jgi:prepilin-type N-terminal cleavage/methylation domain-containing protein/prepilin-type processing-associated H-X9-DG protein
MRLRRAGFTLVELLVVIGIIAVLIGILLPALGAARRQAQTVKCATALREIGNAFQMYAIENKGWYPVAQISPPVYSFNTYQVNDIVYPNSGVGAYWFNFLAKYVTKGKVGVESTNAQDTSLQRGTSIFWNCPAWDGYITGSAGGGGYNRVQTGYGMNGWPTFREFYPTPPQAFPVPPAAQDYKEGVFVYRNGSTDTGWWRKQIEWTRGGANRLLLADSRFWLAESNPPPTQATYPPAVVPQPAYSSSITYTAGVAGQTTIDIYRHGKYPSRMANNTLDPWGGKIAFNVLYCDGHVATALHGEDAYRSTRMKFPG